jgi:hypothetical protein
MNLPHRPEPPPELSVYRDRTCAMLRRYLRMSLATGRLPSLLGQGEQMFRARVTSYRMHSFEDVVIFVHDVERCVAQMDERSREVLVRVVLQEYSFDEAAPLLHCSRRSLARVFHYALDTLTEIFLKTGIMEPYGFSKKRPSAACQEGDSAA